MGTTAAKPRPADDAAQRPGTAAGAPRRRLPAAERLPLILQAAFDEFAAHGYASASMAAVAARAGVAKGLVYHYFPSKAELFKAVVRGFLLPLFEEAERLVAGFGGARAELMRAIIGVGYERAACDPRGLALFRLLLAEGERFPELTDFYREEVLDRAAALLGRVIESGVARGEFRESPVRAAPLAVMGPVVLADVWQLLFGARHPIDLAALREAHVDLVLHGLLA